MSIVRLRIVACQTLSQEEKDLIGMECFIDLENKVSILFA